MGGAVSVRRPTARWGEQAARHSRVRRRRPAGPGRVEPSGAGSPSTGRRLLGRRGTARRGRRLGSFGRPSMRSAMMLRWIWSEPPPIEFMKAIIRLTFAEWASGTVGPVEGAVGAEQGVGRRPAEPCRTRDMASLPSDAAGENQPRCRGRRGSLGVPTDDRAQDVELGESLSHQRVGAPPDRAGEVDQVEGSADRQTPAVAAGPRRAHHHPLVLRAPVAAPASRRSARRPGGRTGIRASVRKTSLNCDVAGHLAEWAHLDPRLAHRQDEVADAPGAWAGPSRSGR